MSDTVECVEHGRTNYALLCKHLRNQHGLSFYAVPHCPHGPAQAWCEACDSMLAAERGWSDRAEAEAGFQLFCGYCYRRHLRRHHFIQFLKGTDDDCDWSNEDAPNAGVG